ncbi:tRNA (adenosine(37)-N6)-threonylcarbamoyltransferase complex ATPase subunit type 1 TsaE [Deinococcus yavapaiensis]|uniref:tRNA threonylcarbamoyladenosine biosynthesis protein TsaE n=1 Tax=Deinococcus yavapaiensis KR-236 TaxID=694435 RepID=A0A318SLY3_9DEIO|nr:tRNA (adenosine(37)-N6)-threonylcarbamoyltransferase complex ATPase subunit type 1 TsaE [Deinococcus yavapaiensis]PYE55693.1 tRNA threonylcarbamoyladenosine biosynthesis protein TsaE [Deinococcus yavapaiensis KR-236]
MKIGESLFLQDAEETRALGASLASALPRGGLLFLEGELGSGKTTLTTGLMTSLKFSGEVSSPTYALMQIYPTAEGDVVHVDAYRVKHPDELYSMDLERLVDDSRLSIMEWGQLYYDDFPQAWLLRLTYDGDARRATRVR